MRVCVESKDRADYGGFVRGVYGEGDGAEREEEGLEVGAAVGFFASPRRSRLVCVVTLAVSVLEASGAGARRGKGQERRRRVGLLVQCFGGREVGYLR